MFANLIESASHVREYKRRSSFFLVTVAAYCLVLCAAGVASVYAYDAQLEAQTNSLEILSWVPPVTAVPKPVQPDRAQVIRRSTPTNAPVDRNIRIAERVAIVPPTNDPRVVPTDVGVKAGDIPPTTGAVRITGRNADPPFSTQNDGCTTCNNTHPIVVLDNDAKPPEPIAPVKPATQRVTSIVLNSKVINLPPPAYPVLARQIRKQGPVNVQILVDEQGKVVSAQAVSGDPMLTGAAREAALRARFTPTMLNGQAVKIQGVITYNFVLQ